MKKRVWGIIFCLCLFVTLLPTAALAAKNPTKVMVGGTNVVTDSTSYWRSNGSGGIEAGSAAGYTVMFTPATNEHTAILTLNEADINGGSGTGDEDSAIYFIGAPLEIHLIGDSYVTKNDGGAWRSAIKAYGHLTITAENKNCSAEITAEGGGLTYQWYINRNDGHGRQELSGKTGTSYKTASVTMENDGYQYECLVSDAHGNTLRSEIAALHVSPLVPVTGDSGKPLLWLGICLLCGLGLALTALKMRRA